MGKKAPFWIYVEELADKLRKGARPLSFPEIKQIADRDWPTLSDQQRERYKALSRQDRIAAPVIRYEPPPPLEAEPHQNTPSVPDYSHVLEKPFTLVDSPHDTTIANGGEIALAGFTLRGGVTQFLSAHLLPSTAVNVEAVRCQLELPIIQQSSIIISSASDILTELSQFCACEQCSAGKIVLFAKRSRVKDLRNVFAGMLEKECSNISIIVEPIEKLIGVIHVALAHQSDSLDLEEVTRIADDILLQSLAHAKVPCSRHRQADVACAHGGVSALCFSFLKAFDDDLKPLGVRTSNATHTLQPKKGLKPCAESRMNSRQSTDKPMKVYSPPAKSMAVVPGEVVFVPGRGRLRTTAKLVPWDRQTNAEQRGETLSPEV